MPKRPTTRRAQGLGETRRIGYADGVKDLWWDVNHAQSESDWCDYTEAQLEVEKEGWFEQFKEHHPESDFLPGDDVQGYYRGYREQMDVWIDSARKWCKEDEERRKREESLKGTKTMSRRRTKFQLGLPPGEHAEEARQHAKTAFAAAKLAASQIGTQNCKGAASTLLKASGVLGAAMRDNELASGSASKEVEQSAERLHEVAQEFAGVCLRAPPLAGYGGSSRRKRRARR